MWQESHALEKVADMLSTNRLFSWKKWGISINLCMADSFPDKIGLWYLQKQDKNVNTEHGGH